MGVFEWVVPPGAVSGQQFSLMTPSGKHVVAVIPSGKKPGDTVHFELDESDNKQGTETGAMQDPAPSQDPEPFQNSMRPNQGVSNKSQVFEWPVPSGARPGQRFSLVTPSGQRVAAIVPEGKSPGDVILFELKADHQDDYGTASNAHPTVDQGPLPTFSAPAAGNLSERPPEASWNGPASRLGRSRTDTQNLRETVASTPNLHNDAAHKADAGLQIQGDISARKKEPEAEPRKAEELNRVLELADLERKRAIEERKLADVKASLRIMEEKVQAKITEAEQRQAEEERRRIEEERRKAEEIKRTEEERRLAEVQNSLRRMEEERLKLEERLRQSEQENSAAREQERARVKAETEARLRAEVAARLAEENEIRRLEEEEEARFTLTVQPVDKGEDAHPRGPQIRDAEIAASPDQQVFEESEVVAGIHPGSGMQRASGAPSTAAVIPPGKAPDHVIHSQTQGSEGVPEHLESSEEGAVGSSSVLNARSTPPDSEGLVGLEAGSRLSGRLSGLRGMLPFGRGSSESALRGTGGEACRGSPSGEDAGGASPSAAAKIKSMMRRKSTLPSGSPSPALSSRPSVVTWFPRAPCSVSLLTIHCRFHAAPAPHAYAAVVSMEACERALLEVEARRTHQRTFELAAGSVLHWFLATKDHRIKMLLKVVHVDRRPLEEAQLEPFPSKIDQHHVFSGTHAAVHASALTFSWDNSHNWTKPKSLAFGFWIEKAQGGDAHCAERGLARSAPGLESSSSSLRSSVVWDQQAVEGQVASGVSGLEQAQGLAETLLAMAGEMDAAKLLTCIGAMTAPFDGGATMGLGLILTAAKKIRNKHAEAQQDPQLSAAVGTVMAAMRRLERLQEESKRDGVKLRRQVVEVSAEQWYDRYGDAVRGLTVYARYCDQLASSSFGGGEGAAPSVQEQAEMEAMLRQADPTGSASKLRDLFDTCDASNRQRLRKLVFLLFDANDPRQCIEAIQLHFAGMFARAFGLVVRAASAASARGMISVNGVVMIEADLRSMQLGVERVVGELLCEVCSEQLQGDAASFATWHMATWEVYLSANLLDDEDECGWLVVHSFEVPLPGPLPVDKAEAKEAWLGEPSARW